MSDVTIFSWIHVSDIHRLQPPERLTAEQHVMLNILCEDISSRPWDCDALFVSGDIAYSSAAKHPEEYSVARDTLERIRQSASISKKMTFIVPGNHDVDQGVEKADRNTFRLIETLRSGDSIDEALSHDGDKSMLLARQEKFWEFAKSEMPEIQPKNGSWRHRLCGNKGVLLRFAGLNSALCSSKEDNGTLQIGNIQIGHCFQEPTIPEEEIVISMTHHPLGPQFYSDHEGPMSLISRYTDIHMSGHVHKHSFDRITQGHQTNHYCRLTAGALHDSGTLKLVGYSFCSLIHKQSNNSLSLRVEPRKWSTETARFVPASEHCIEGTVYAELEVRRNYPLPNERKVGSRAVETKDLASNRPTPLTWTQSQTDALAKDIQASLDIPVELIIVETDKVAVFLKVHISTLRATITATFAKAACMLAAAPQKSIIVGFHDTASVSPENGATLTPLVTVQTTKEQVTSYLREDITLTQLTSASLVVVTPDNDSGETHTTTIKKLDNVLAQMGL